MSNVAIIPARGGSQRIPRKNIRMFHGKPIIAYSIEAARAANVFSSIIVSTDDDEIRDIAAHYGATVFRRENDNGNRGTLSVTGEAARYHGVQDGDLVCCIYATAPMLMPAKLVSGMNVLQTAPYACHCIAIGTAPLRDAAQFYWSVGNIAKEESDYWVRTTVGESVPENTICDINTDDDWAKAERMYEALHR